MSGRPPLSSTRTESWPPRWLTERKGPTARGDEAIAFIQAYCRVVKDSVGGGVGSPLVLRPWQKVLIRQLLAERPDGRLQHRQALIGMARKNGKSALLSGLALWSLLLGVDGGEVYSIAGDQAQARITFGTARRMVEMDPLLMTECKLYRDAIEVPGTGSVWRVLASDAALREGLSPTMTLVDEVHVLDRDLWDVFALAQGARLEPLMIGITTAGTRTDTLGRETLCYGMYRYGQSVAQGHVDNPTFFFAWWEPEQGAAADHHDPKVWAEANPGIGDIVTVEDFESTVRSIPEAEFRTKRTNVFVTSMLSWLPHGAWDACAVPDRKLQPAETVVLGFDGSKGSELAHAYPDTTALVACTLDGYVEIVGHWAKPPDMVGAWRVEIAEVEEAIRVACRTYDVLEVACDPFGWQPTLQKLEGEGLPMVEWPTNSSARMVPATGRFGAAVIDKTISHNGDVRLAQHIANAVLKVDYRGAWIVKEQAMSGRKIDLAVAAVVAYDRAMQLTPDDGPHIW